MFTTPGSRVATKKKPITAIATSGNGLTLSTSFFTADQRSSARKKQLIVPAGVTLGGCVTGVMNGAFEIIVLGNADGLGGAAATTTAAPGGNGGDAIRCDMDSVMIRVRGGGNLRGGGSGAGKGGDGRSNNTQGEYSGAEPEYYWNTAGNGFTLIYWGGKIYEANPGPPLTDWNRGDGYLYSRAHLMFGSVWAITQSQITTSGAAGRGQGYDGAKTNGVAGGAGSGLSGNGGDWGTAGTNGAAGNSGSGSNAGSPGKAVNFNGRMGCSVVNEGGTILGVAS
jgi:hypothetical protein